MARYWIVGMAIVLLGVQFAMFGYLHKSASTTPTTPEITLGDFFFEQPSGGEGLIQEAKFQLHIGLLPEVDRYARARLAERRFKVQQGIEELLRQAHPADFEDPSLGELKRQFQEQINTALGMRAVSEIIITDLVLKRAESAQSLVTTDTSAPPALPPTPVESPPTVTAY
jgi:flagellar basal body-associated protein FliL